MVTTNQLALLLLLWLQFWTN